MPNSLIDMLFGAQPTEPQPPSPSLGQSPLVGLIMGNDPRSQAAAAQAGQVGSNAGEAVRGWLGDVATGKVAANGLENMNDIFRRTRSPNEEDRRNALVDLASTFGFAAPIRAYHGSPHDFDKFDLSKIGTGEGAQAYGHGLYFAESEPVAKAYRDNVKNMDLIYRVNSRLSQIANERDKIRESGALFDKTSPDRQRFMDLASEYDKLMEQKLAPGRMYEVNLHADPQSFLDWNKPLSKNSIGVQEALGWTPDLRSAYDATTRNVDDALLGALKGNVDPSSIDALSRRADEINRAVGFRRDATGADIVKGNSVFDRPSDVSRSEMLRDRGIPGIRYLDQGSRAAGEGTNNYVVFDPKIIEILRKYGLAGLLGGSGAAASGGQE